MLLESMIDHEYPLTMKMEVEAPTVSAVERSFIRGCVEAFSRQPG